MNKLLILLQIIALHSSSGYSGALPRWLLLTTGLYSALDQFTMKASDGSVAVAMSSVVPVVQFGATPISHSPGYMSTTLPFTTVALPVSGDHTELHSVSIMQCDSDSGYMELH